MVLHNKFYKKGAHASLAPSPMVLATLKSDILKKARIFKLVEDHPLK